MMIELYKTKANTYILYNPFTCFEFVFYFFVIREIVKNETAKKVLLILMIVYPIGAITNIYFFQGKTQFHVFTYSIGCLLIVGCCIYYFYELFLLPNSVNLLKQPPFWICTALLFFYAFTYPFFGLSNLLTNLPNTILIPLIQITRLLNNILYSLFSIAFLCRLRIRRY
jgi:magnesium-transporting ATPase (P-type)